MREMGTTPMTSEGLQCRGMKTTLSRHRWRKNTLLLNEQTTARTVEAFGTRPVAEKSAERTTTSEDNALTKSGNTFKH